MLVSAARRVLTVRAAALPASALACIVLGATLRAAPAADALGDVVWTVGLVLTGMPVIWRTLRSAFAGHFATDLVAMLAITGAVALRQPLAGLIVVLMQTGGEALERFAEGRASSALRALEESAPKSGHRLRGGAAVEDIAASEIAIGDALLVRPGELVPCDAVVTSGRSHVDASRLTGEPVPISAGAGTRLMSGSANLEGSLTVRAVALASESRYARIVELVRTAQASKAPLQRMADRYAMWFTPVTLAVCLLAYLVSGDAGRVLAVLVIATPCPLIIATPVAIIGGINRAARRQIIVRTGGALERIAGVRVAVFDKTGTLTIGLPAVSRVVATGAFTEGEVLRLAASVEQASSHLLARTVVDAARAARVELAPASQVTEVAGRGVVGDVDGRTVLVGGASFARERHPHTAAALAALEGRGAGLRAFVTVNGHAAGMIEFADQLRPGVRGFVAGLSEHGISRVILLSGDTQAHTRSVADELGIADARGELLPEDKVAVVRALVAQGERVLAVGDGTNDAPALSSATVGIALAGHGTGITAEAADIVLLADDVRRVADAVRIGRDTLRIAKQSIWAGLALSAVGMAAASAGFVAPAVGALLQEMIDVAAILNALRASREGGRSPPTPDPIRPYVARAEVRPLSSSSTPISVGGPAMATSASQDAPGQNRSG